MARSPLSAYLMPLFGYGNNNPLDQHPPSRDEEVDSAEMDQYSQIEVASPPLLRMPAEIIHNIFANLEIQHLVSVIRTCRQLKVAADEDRLWSGLLRSHIPDTDFPSSSPYPAPSYRDLYLSHHPYWFLPRNKIWISDEPLVGKLILCKFDPRRGCIEGYRLIAERTRQDYERWSYKPSVVIHNFDARAYLWFDSPVLNLAYEITPSKLAHPQDGWQGEVNMTLGGVGHSTSAAFFLSKNIPKSSQYPGMNLWPPRTIPDMPRVRAESLDKFQSKGHRPSNLKDISQTTFRMRHWSHFSPTRYIHLSRIGEEVSTWSTLDPSLYTPTEDKPYQGIFVGDYAGHGCEFLLIMQTDKAPPPAHRDLPSEYLSLLLRAMDDEVEVDLVNSSSSQASTTNLNNPASSKVVPNVQNERAHRGAIEAVKLTGDPHVPRGEHTFIADDISNTGLIRIAEEHPFEGARIVKSRGHVAARGFQNDEFVPSQLIMINPDKLAQYWIPFGHISYYERIDIDLLLNHSSYRRASS